jgi:hypothetical protein
MDIPAGFILGEYTGLVKPQIHDEYDPSRYLFSIYDQVSADFSLIIPFR